MLYGVLFAESLPGAVMEQIYRFNTPRIAAPEVSSCQQRISSHHLSLAMQSLTSIFIFEPGATGAKSSLT